MRLLHAQDNLNLRILHVFQGSFLLSEAHFIRAPDKQSKRLIK